MLLPYSAPRLVAAATAVAAAAGPATLPATTTHTPIPIPHIPAFAVIQHSLQHATTDGAAFATPSPAPGRGGYYHENWSSLIGIITAIVGNILISFALNMQRYAHIRLEREWREKEKDRKDRASDSSREEDSERYRDEEAEEEDEDRQPEGRNGATANEHDPLLPHAHAHPGPRPHHKRTDTTSTMQRREDAAKQKSYLRSPFWWTGIILMTTGEAGNFLAYGFAPASIVSPLGVVALISNCIIAPIMLKEPFRVRDGVGVLVAVAGAVTVVLSAGRDNPKLGPQDIWKLIATWEFETYAGVTVGVIAALMWVSGRTGWGRRSVLVDLGLVGLFGGYTALSTKGVASMLSYTLWRAITFPVTYLLVAILIFTAIMQIKYVNRALQHFDATQVIPVQFVLFTLSVILGSAILYRDFERTSASDAGKFVGGCALTFLGVWCITTGRHGRKDEDEEDRDPEGEEAIGLRYQDEVDGAAEDDEHVSRRSSTIRAASPPLIITNTKLSAREPSTPMSKSPVKRFLDSHHRGSPANGSGNGNTWAQIAAAAPPSTPQRDPQPMPPPPQHRHSSPTLPTEATTADSLTATATATTASLSDPHFISPRPSTPTRHASDNILPTTPGTGGAALPSRLRRGDTIDRAGTRSSIPSGPLLASPLSTTLTAMVADLKRGGTARLPFAEATRRSSMLGFGSGAGEHDGQAGGRADEFGEPLERRRTTGAAGILGTTLGAGGEERSWERGEGRAGGGGGGGGGGGADWGRKRSLSDALANMFRGVGGGGGNASGTATPSVTGNRDVERGEDGRTEER